jgi:thioredoxin 1
VLEDVAAQMGGRVKVVKVNVDENQRTASRYGIASIPAFKIFRNGSVVDELIGAVPRNSLFAFAERHAA